MLSLGCSKQKKRGKKSNSEVIFKLELFQDLQVSSLFLCVKPFHHFYVFLRRSKGCLLYPTIIFRFMNKPFTQTLAGLLFLTCAQFNFSLKQMQIRTHVSVDREIFFNCFRKVKSLSAPSFIFWICFAKKDDKPPSPHARSGSRSWLAHVAKPSWTLNWELTGNL